MHAHYVVVDAAKIWVTEVIPSHPSSLPIVVLIPGLGGTAQGWCAVQRLLPPHLRSFSYDRLGINKSDRTTLLRPAATLARELKSTLTACSAPAPYLLVLSSYAGIIGREFLEAFDSDVAGLVYVDANQERSQLERQWPLEATGRLLTTAFSTNDATGLAAAHRCTPAEWAALAAEEDAKRLEKESGTDPVTGEWSLYESSLLALGEHRQLDRQALGARPLSVIQANLTRDFVRMFAAGKAAGLGTAEDHRVVDEFCARLPEVELRLNSDVLRLSSLHRLIVTSVAGHSVGLWEPELVVQEVMWCLGHFGKKL